VAASQQAVPTIAAHEINHVCSTLRTPLDSTFGDTLKSCLALQKEPMSDADSLPSKRAMTSRLCLFRRRVKWVRGRRSRSTCACAYRGPKGVCRERRSLAVTLTAALQVLWAMLNDATNRSRAEFWRADIVLGRPSKSFHAGDAVVRSAILRQEKSSAEVPLKRLPALPSGYSYSTSA
jgi:hypothetical protein